MSVMKGLIIVLKPALTLLDLILVAVIVDTYLTVMALLAEVINSIPMD